MALPEGAVPLEVQQASAGGAEEPPYNADAYVEWATDRACEGKLGTYQIKILLLMSNAWIIAAWHTYSWGFITVEPDINDHLLKPICGRVLVPELLSPILDPEGQCRAELVTEWGKYCPELESETCVPTNATEGKAAYRDFWTYRDPQNSAKAEFDMSDCSSLPGFATTVGQFFWYSYALGVVSSGVLADLYGRKKTYMGYLSLMMLGSIIMSVAPNRWILGIGRLVDGFGIGGYGITGFIWASESLNKEAQPYMTWVPSAWFILGGFLPSCLTIFVSSWRTYSWITSLACIPFFFIAPLFFESPKWLAANQMRTEVGEVMKGITEINGKPAPAPPAKKRGQRDIEDDQEQAKPAVAPSEPESASALLHPKVLPRLLINSALWFVASFSYYGLSLFAPPNLFDPKVYTYARVFNWCFGFAVEFPAYYSSGYLVESRIGRKGTCPGLICLGGALLLLAGTQPELPDGEELPAWESTAYAMLYYLARMVIAAGFQTIYPFSAELFPSSVRSTAMGFNSFWARMGSSFAPLAENITPFSTRMTTFGLPTLIVAGVAFVMLPETRGRPLPGSVDDL